MTAREELNQILAGFKTRKSRLAQLNDRLDAIISGESSGPPRHADSETVARGLAVLNDQLATIAKMFSEAVEAADAASRVSLRLQRRVWWITFFAVVLAAVAAFGTFAQVYYARRADLRATQPSTPQSQTAIQPIQTAPPAP